MRRACFHILLFALLSRAQESTPTIASLQAQLEALKALLPPTCNGSSFLQRSSTGWLCVTPVRQSGGKSDGWCRASQDGSETVTCDGSLSLPGSPPDCRPPGGKWLGFNLTLAGWICVCNAGWSGTSCNVSTGVQQIGCSTPPVCVAYGWTGLYKYVNGTMACQCLQGWVGVNCSQSGNSTSPQPSSIASPPPPVPPNRMNTTSLVTRNLWQANCSNGEPFLMYHVGLQLCLAITSVTSSGWLNGFATMLMPCNFSAPGQRWHFGAYQSYTGSNASCPSLSSMFASVASDSCSTFYTDLTSLCMNINFGEVSFHALGVARGSIQWADCNSGFSASVWTWDPSTSLVRNSCASLQQCSGSSTYQNTCVGVFNGTYDGINGLYAAQEPCNASSPLQQFLPYCASTSSLTPPGSPEASLSSPNSGGGNNSSSLSVLSYQVNASTGVVGTDFFLVGCTTVGSINGVAGLKLVNASCGVQLPRFFVIGGSAEFAQVLQPASMCNGVGFTISFSMLMVQGSNPTPDGLSFALVDATQITPGAAGGISGSGVPETGYSLSVDFDSWDNSDQIGGTGVRVIALTTNDTYPGGTFSQGIAGEYVLGMAGSPSLWNTGAWVAVRLTFIRTTGSKWLLGVYMSGTQVHSAVDVTSYLPNTVFMVAQARGTYDHWLGPITVACADNSSLLLGSRPLGSCADAPSDGFYKVSAAAGSVYCKGGFTLVGTYSATANQQLNIISPVPFNQLKLLPTQNCGGICNCTCPAAQCYATVYTPQCTNFIACNSGASCPTQFVGFTAQGVTYVLQDFTPPWTGAVTGILFNTTLGSPAMQKQLYPITFGDFETGSSGGDNSGTFTADVYVL